MKRKSSSGVLLLIALILAALLCLQRFVNSLNDRALPTVIKVSDSIGDNPVAVGGTGPGVAVGTHRGETDRAQRLQNRLASGKKALDAKQVEQAVKKP
jgi:hypothetical protein